MGCCTLTKGQTQSQGLDELVSGLVAGDQSLMEAYALESLIEASLEQLEFDDTFSPAVTDAIVDSLVSAQELLEEGQVPWGELEKMMNLYYQAKSQKTIFEVWSDRLEAFTSEDIRTSLWDQFQEAVSLVKSGKIQVVASWLEATIQRFESQLANYQTIYVVPDEITMESEMCHYFLVEGIAAWLEALRQMKSGNVSTSTEVAAERGQRYLMAVQVYEAEATLAESRYFVNFN